MRSFHERCIALQSENGQELPPSDSWRTAIPDLPGKEKAERPQTRHEAVHIRRATPTKRTTAAGSTAARLRVVSKCAFALAGQREKSVQINPRRPRIGFSLPIYHRPSSLCHSTTNELPVICIWWENPPLTY